MWAGGASLVPSPKNVANVLALCSSTWSVLLGGEAKGHYSSAHVVL
jgi:hypothetical protein